MITLRYFDEIGEGTRVVDNYLVIKDYQYAQLIYVQHEAICYDKESKIIHFCVGTINEALEKIQKG